MPTRRLISSDEVISKVCARFVVDSNWLKRRRCFRIKAVIVYLLKKHRPHMSYPDCAEAIGLPRSAHATLIEAHRRALNWCVVGRVNPSSLNPDDSAALDVLLLVDCDIESYLEVGLEASLN